MTGYLSFAADLADPATVAPYDELPLWSAMAGLLLVLGFGKRSVRPQFLRGR